ncbi:spore germination protein [Priestia taiwanensis]|uniref:Spore germination protein n=1 Tax=Priestia taiwanensis TaxID=1347902 RepID=A0A917AT83_9BACI|nr:spore germination protein [Priestia taiwanensis]MBM7363800.1 stage V sporulation protein AF [Priestia taiwanensis]GGE74014.1 spore germination protein [Priestia taiwanensis]
MTKEKKQTRLASTYEENVHYLKEQMRVSKSFDVIHKEMEYAGKKMSFFFVDGFVKDDMMLYIMQDLAKLRVGDLQEDTLHKLIHLYIPYVEVDKNNDLDTIIDSVLAGQTALVVEGEQEIILIDARTYPVRGPEEPDLERVVRGSRDGFVETIIFNTALLRRRVRDRTLVMNYLQIGRRSKTDVCVCYIEDIADDALIDKVRKSLELIDVDGLPMADKTIEEYIAGRHWNPYPSVRYTERPDTAASHLYDGHVLIIIDGSPSVMITPTTFWHHMQHAEDYRNKPIVGAYLRFVRFLAVFSSIFFLPFFYLLATNPNLLPANLVQFIPTDFGSVPLIVQLITIELGIDVLRMASIHTPSSLSSALGLVAAVAVGGVAVDVGFYTADVVMYLSVAALGTFTTPSYELSLANRMFRIILLLLTAFFRVNGFVIGFTLWMLYLIRMKSYQVPYLWPLVPFNSRALRDILLRSPMPLKDQRPTVLHPNDPDR